jgi:GNAT superfamily N-acetyltransferase
MEVKLATARDVPGLCGLLAVLFAQEAEFRPDAAAQARGLSMILDDPALGAILVACEQDRLLGMVNLLYTVSTALGCRVALLEDMVVAPGARGRGIGGHLLTTAIAHAHAAGCQRITLLTDTDNVSAQGFYRRHGFVSSPMLPMRLALS